MLGLAFVAVGSFCRRSFASAVSFSPFRLFLPLRRCPILMRGLLRKSRTPGLHLLLPPSLQKGGLRWGDLGMPLCCFPRVFLSSRSTLVQREGWRSLWSLVRCTGARFCLLGSFVDWGSRSCFLAADSCYPLCPVWLSLLISARPARWWGGRVFGGLLCSRLPLPPYLCTPCEVMRRESLRSFRPS